MRSTRFAVVLGCVLLASACSERATVDSVAGPNFHQSRPPTQPGCLSHEQVEDLIEQLFPRANREAVESRYEQITRKDNPKVQALQLVDFILKKYRDGKLAGGQSATTQQRTVALLNAVLCAAGLPQVFTAGSLSDDAAVALINPNDPTTTVVTGTGFAGVVVPSGTVNEPTLFTVTRLPDFPGPLLTEFDQYPLYYEYHATGPLTQDVTVGLCIATSVTPPDLGRLRLAHNVAPFTPGSIEVLPLAAAPFVDCTNADLAAARSPRWMELAGFSIFRRAADVLLPRPLYAMKKMFGAGIGGTVRSFSPFGAVDTLAVMTPVAGPNMSDNTGRPVDIPPAVELRTPGGHLMAGIAVQFTQTQGDAVLVGGGAVVSGSNGRAGVTSWIVGTVMSRMTALASSPAGTGFLGNPVIFTANVVR